MPFTCINNVSVKTISLAIPDRKIDIFDEIDLFDGDEKYLQKVIKSSGLRYRTIAPESLTSGDLCAEAAFHCLENSKFETSQIDGLILVTETPDYIVPSTSYVLHDRLGLKSDCAVFDVNLGCSGYVYGLWLASSLIASGGCENILLLAGDTLTRTIHPQDRSVRILFGDAGSATLVCKDEKAGKSYYNINSDGSGFKKLIIPHGGFRNPYAKESFIPRKDKQGCYRAESNLFMSGGDIFGFSISKVPENIKAIIKYSGLDIESIDAFFLHQANKYIIDSIAKKIGVKPGLVPCTALEKFGNLSCASIPSIICEYSGHNITAKVLLCGYGVGLSWASSILDFNNVITGRVEVKSE